MYKEQAIINCELFSEDIILKQVEKILNHPLFSVSEILRKFLKYVIRETLSGKANQLKEYTIAVYVLNKPANFKSLRDGIVRVHACRLRDALSSYYNTWGVDDICEIVIPKGGYIPVFRPLKHDYMNKSIQITNDLRPEEKMSIAVIPFKSFEAASHRLAFTDNIGRMLSTEFIHSTNFAVLSYYTTQRIKFENRSIKSIASEYAIQYVLVGNVQFEHNKVRVAVQLINAGTEMILWSEIYTHDYNASSPFETQDTVVYQIISGLEEFNSHFRKKQTEKLEKVQIEEVADDDIITLRETPRKKTV